MGNQIVIGERADDAKINMEISSAFDQILKCPTQTDMNHRLNALLNMKYGQSEWVGSITSEDVRQYYYDQRENVEQILQFTIDTLFEAVSKKQDISASSINILNNSLRIITKLMPVLYENQEKAQRFLWHVDNLNYSTKNIQMNKNSKLKIYRSNDEDIDKKIENSMSEGLKLIYSLQTLTSYPGFTILPSEQLAQIPKDGRLGSSVDNSRLWSNLVLKPVFAQSKQLPHPNSATHIYDESRFLVLSAILACCAQTLFIPCFAQNYLNPWITYLTSPINKGSRQFFMNLLFQTLQYQSKLVNRTNEVITKQISLISSQLVYAILCHQQKKSEDLSRLVEVNSGLQQMSDHFMSLLGDQGEGNKNEEEEQEEEKEIELATILSNDVLTFLKSVKQPESFQIEVISNLMRLLEEPLKTENSLFVNSLKERGINEEIFGILQQFMYNCPLIYDSICSDPKKLLLLFKVTIFQFCKSLDEGSRNNTYFVSLSLLTIMSNNPKFNELLNTKKDFNMNLKHFPIIDGSLADLLISCCAQAIINNRFSNSLCHPFNLMTILKNIAPYVRGLTRVTCQKLNSLVIVFTEMAFLTLNQYSPLCIVKLLEMYDHILSRNMPENVALVFEIFQRQEIFSRIPKINFREATLRAYSRQVQSQQAVPKVQQPNQPGKENGGSNNNVQQQSSKNNQNLSTPQKQGGGGGVGISPEKSSEQKMKEASNQKPDQLGSSHKLGAGGDKKRPKRVIKGKKTPSLAQGNDAEQTSFREKQGNQQPESDKENKGKIEEEDEEVEESKENVLSALGDIQKEEEQDTKRVEIVIKQRSMEDRFVERWMDFDWPKISSNIPISNLSIVMKQMNEFVNSTLKKSRYELKFEQFHGQKAFIGNLKNSMVIKQPVLSEHFSNDEDILVFAQQCCWMQILTKHQLFPALDPTIVLYFRSDIPPISINLSDHSVDVEFNSSNGLGDGDDL